MNRTIVFDCENKTMVISYGMKITFKDLRPDELRVIELTTQGLSAKEIGALRGLSESRVSNLRSRILRSLGYKNCAQLSWEYYGYKNGKRESSK